MRNKYIVIFILGLIISFSVVFVNFYFFNSTTTQAINEERTISQEEIDLLLKQGKKEYYNGNLEKAVNTYEDILLYNNHTDTLKNLYFINKELGNLKESNKYLKIINELNKDNYYWKYKYGVNLFLAGKVEEAREILEKVYDDQQELIINKNENTDKTQVEASNETNISNLLSEKEISLLSYYLGQIYFFRADYQKAEIAYNNGIKISSYLTLNYIGLAELYKNIQEYDKAVDYYLSAIKKDSSLSELYPQIAELYDLLDNESKSFYYWKRSLSTGNNTGLARKRIHEISSKHPEYIKKEEQEKELRRKNIQWLKVEDYFLEDNDTIPEIRIGIVDNVNKVSFKAGTDFLIKGADNNIILEGNRDEAYLIEYTDSIYMIYHNQSFVKSVETQDHLSIQTKDSSYPFLLYDISYGEGYFWAGTEDRQYRGSLEMYPINNSGFNIINILNLEEYLFSVVPSEMPAWWPDNAIKAQIVAARSYALSNMGKHKKDGYDLCDTVHCAAYNGIKSETRKTNQLIIDTLGEAAIYNDRAIAAVFSSNSGGYSEKSKEIWGYENLYLLGANNMKENIYEFPLEPYLLEKWLIDEPESFSNNTTFAGYNSYRWIKIIEPEYLTKKYGLSALEDILSIKRSNGGTVNRIIIKGKERNVEISGDSIRSALGGLKSNRFVIEKVYTPDKKLKKIILYGSGWGHHVGMDQTGAAGMAAENYDYKEIIKHFYQNVKIEKKY